MTVDANTVDIRTVTADVMNAMTPDQLRMMMVRLVNAYNESNDAAWALEDARARATGQARRAVCGHEPYLRLRTQFWAKAYGLESDQSHSERLKENRDGTHTLTPEAVAMMQAHDAQEQPKP